MNEISTSAEAPESVSISASQPKEGHVIVSLNDAGKYLLQPVRAIYAVNDGTVTVGLGEAGQAAATFVADQNIQIKLASSSL
ncbi:hypothetical protein ACQUKI_03460 [Ralstonia pseudosolanacearum]